MRTLLLASMFGLVTLNGCATTGFGYHHHSYGHHGDGGGGFALLTGILVGAAISESLHDSPREPEVLTDAEPPPNDAPPPPALTAWPLPPPLPERVHAPGLDPIVARNALRAVDVSACRKEQAAPIGYGHARVTFDPDGVVKSVVVDGPAGLSDAAVACIGAKIGEASVPPFRGPATTAGYTFRIE